MRFIRQERLRARRLAVVTASAVAVAVASAAATHAGEAGPGITTPVVLPRYDAAAPACTPPAGLQRTLVFLQDNEREFIEGVASGLAAAARDRGLEFKVALADNDIARQQAQAADALAAKAGAVVIAPIDARAMTKPLQQLIGSGTYVGAVVPPPATTILNAPQYETGKALGEAAAAYITEKLGGQARVVLLTQDSNQFLAPRFVAIRDALAKVPGASIVADISPTPVDEQGGFATMQTVLLAQPSVDVVLGADTVVLGALRALRLAGRDRPDQFLGGIDGEPEAIAEIKAGGPYKASVSLSAPVFAYAMGQHAADWLEGKSIPQAMDILPRAIDAANLAQYDTDQADPAAVWADPARRDSYLRMYGNICPETRDQYLNFPWSSERR